MKSRPGISGLYNPSFEHESCGVGFVAHIKGKKSRAIIDSAKEILLNMTHRGAVGSDKLTGDGAGILTTLPQDFLERVARDDLNESLPPRGLYSAGNVFLPVDQIERTACKHELERIIGEENQRLIGWRELPRDTANIGLTAREAEPAMEQLFVAAGDGVTSDEFERALYVIRKRATHLLHAGENDRHGMFYVCSLSVRVIVYKGMLMPRQLFSYYKDLMDPDFTSHLAMIHSRFSTNTFPSWDRAQPLRFMSHNGEINTLRGNANKMAAREGRLESELFGNDLAKTFPVIEPDQSDSGNFDNVLELLLMAGRELPEAVMMMVPEAWQKHKHMPDIGSAMYEFMSTQMESWDGPASIVFTDGHVIGAVLDRNGLRPSRYYVTDDDIVVMASEVGVLDIPPEKVVLKNRLKPGRMFLVDFEKGEILNDVDLKNGIANRHPFRKWLNEERIVLKDLSEPREVAGLEPVSLLARLRMFGYTREHLSLILGPMARLGKEPLGSMGNDTPLACLSDKPRMLYDYFKQLFAQVTNPPIDSIREDIIMSLVAYVGPEQNLLSVSPSHAHRLFLMQPLLTNSELSQLKEINHRGWSAKTIDITYPARDSRDGLLSSLDRIAAEAEQAITDGYSLVVLSDRAAGPERIPVSALLATGTVQHHLVRGHKRTQIGVIVESGEPREVHHFCMLVGYGADAVNPYLAYEAMWKMRDDGELPESLRDEEIVERYHSAVEYGMRKVFGKMGISTLESYKGAQIFEAVGLSDTVVDRSFAGTASRIKGAGFAELAEEARRRHDVAYSPVSRFQASQLQNPGDYQWRTGGEKHMWDPESITLLQHATRFNDPMVYADFAERQDRRSQEQATLRGLLRIRDDGEPISLDEVEPAHEIVTRFVTGAMSFGSISQEAHETLAIAMNRIGGKSNTGEGGELRERYVPLPNGDSKRSAIKQVASGRFGVTIEYLANADELQIKMAQGAKPGEGGELPGHKVFDIIAKTRYSTPGVGLISPPPHHDIYSIEDLAQLIFDLKNANPSARISVKLVSEVGVGTVAAGVAKAHADHILISGHDGGTGASPLTGIKHAGLPWELGLAETHQTLVMNDLRSRVVLQTDGQIKTGRDVAIAAMLGAEECGFATSALITLGCVMMRKCEKNTCPVGVATQDPELRKKFTGDAEHVVNYMMFVAEDLRRIMAALGVRSYNELVGRTDLLEMDDAVRTWKAKGVDLEAVLSPAVKKNPASEVFCCIPQEHGLDNVLDRKLVALCERALERGEPVKMDLPIRNANRTTGTMLSHEIAKRYGIDGLPDGTVHVKLTGSAGQSFGAWLAHGVTLELEGDANDYVGKGLSGGTIVAYPPRESTYRSEENIVIGNVALYGAVSGHGFFRGMAAERFCVRNSGAHVVVEGVGDHGCEYMTGGRAVILGGTGRNFGAGMSGGIAYVYDRLGDFPGKVNLGLVELVRLEDEEEIESVRELIQMHADLTGSEIATTVLENWTGSLESFHKVISPAYRRVLELRRERSVREVSV